MLEPFDIASRGLKTFSNRVVGGFVRYNHIASLAESRNDAGYGREGLRVHNASFGPEKISYIGFGLDVDILSTVKLWRTTWANAISPQSLDSLLLDLFVGVEVVKIIRCEIRDGPAARQFYSGSCRPVLMFIYISIMP